jgi:hypothetical protein
MNRPRLSRSLRIAWSVTWGIVAVLLVALWVRSFWILDFVGRGIFEPSETVTISVMSEQGSIVLHRGKHALGEKLRALTDQWEHHTATAKPNTGHFLWHHSNNDLWMQFPIWVPGILVAIAGWIPWFGLKGSFGLRTLLIAATLVSVGLGLIVLAVKSVRAR